jgi:hypothetical protein
MQIIHGFCRKIRMVYEKEKTAQRPTQIYSQRKDAAPLRDFGRERTRNVDRGALSKIHKI